MTFAQGNPVVYYVIEACSRLHNPPTRFDLPQYHCSITAVISQKPTPSSRRRLKWSECNACSIEGIHDCADPASRNCAFQGSGLGRTGPTSSEGRVRAPYDVLPQDYENLDGLISRRHATFLVGLISSSKDFTSRALRFADFKLRIASSVGVVSKFSYVFPFPSNIFKTLDLQFHNHDV